MQTISGTFGVLSYFIGATVGNIELIYFGVILVFFFSVIPPFFIKEPKYLGRFGEDEADIDKRKKLKRYPEVLMMLLSAKS